MYQTKKVLNFLYKERIKNGLQLLTDITVFVGRGRGEGG